MQVVKRRKGLSDDLKIKVLFFIRYFGDALFYGFFYLFLISKGFSEYKVGIIGGVTPLVGLLINPLYNHFCNDVNKSRRVLSVITILEGIFIILIANLSLYEIILVVTGLIAIVGTQFYSLIGGYTDTFCELNNFEYASIRKFGTLGYACGMLFAGLILRFFDYTVLFAISGSLFILTSFFFFLLKDVNLKLIGKEEKSSESFLHILKNRRFLRYVIFYISLITLTNVVHSYVPVYLKNGLGLPDTSHSILDSVRVFSEFFFLLIAPKIYKKMKMRNCYLIITFLYLLQPLAIALDFPKEIFYVTYLARGLAFASLISFYYRHLDSLIGLNNLTHGILTITFFSSIFSIIFNPLYGDILEKFGYQFGYFIVVVTLIISITIFYLSLLKEEKNKSPKR